MIAISSFRPHAESIEYRHNQMRAKESWNKVFERIIYFGNEEKELASPKTTFIANDGWPFIRDVASLAGRQQDFVAILNADIVLTWSMAGVPGRMWEHGCMAATSRRYTFDPTQPINPMQCMIEQEDKGLDIFVAMPPIWARIAVEVPECLRMGHQLWDTWVSGWFTYHLGRSYRNFNEMRAVLHPRHDGRKMPFADTIKPLDRYCQMAEWPAPL